MEVKSMDASIAAINRAADNLVTKDAGIQINQSKADRINHREFAHLTAFEKNVLPVSDKVVLETIERANRAISGANRRFEFSFHEKTQDIMVKVIDSDTNEVLREIPPEKIIDLIANLMEMAGLIVDERR